MEGCRKARFGVFDAIPLLRECVCVCVCGGGGGGFSVHKDTSGDEYGS